MNNELVKKLVNNLETMAYENHNINLGINREVMEKTWEKEGHKRTYLSINCYTLNNRFKGSYKCGYVDMTTGEYVCGKYDDVNADTMEYIGR